MAQDLDKCDQQLAAAKESIANTKIENDRRDALIARTKKEYEDAEANYNQKIVEFNNAKIDYNNFKNTDKSRHYRPEGCSCWSTSSCQNSCNGGKNQYPNSDVDFGVQVRDREKSSYAWWEICHNCCWCLTPNVEGVKGRFDTMNRKKQEMETASADKDKKNNDWKSAIASPISSPQINVSCCSNSVTCGDGADCNKITQSCEAKITSLKDEKAKKEAEEAEAAEAAEAAAKEAASKEAGQKAATDASSKKTGQGATTNVGQKSSNIVSKPTSSSSNNTIISSSIILCCCLLFLIVIIFVIMKSK